jgi:predicted dehydrogenase
VKFVIVGLGSIGKRHQQNLQKLGQITVPCHRNDNLSKILRQENPDGVLICNPTSQHLSPALTAAKLGLPVFVEKPLSHNLDGVDQLLLLVKQKKLILQVGYDLRFEPNLQHIKKQLDDLEIGKPLQAKIVCASYLPDWRPGTDYRKSYSAKQDLGGGVLLDLSHEIDYADWFFGKAKSVEAKIQWSPELEIETEAFADLIIKFESGTVAEIHLDYLSKEYIRNCEIIGEKGKLSWNFAKIRASGWNTNEMYIKEIKNFIGAIQGKEKTLVTGEAGKQVLLIVAAAHKSSLEKRIIEL